MGMCIRILGSEKRTHHRAMMYDGARPWRWTGPAGPEGIQGTGRAQSSWAKGLTAKGKKEEATKDAKPKAEAGTREAKKKTAEEKADGTAELKEAGG